MDKKHLQDNILSQPYNQAVWQDVLRQVFGVKNLFVLPQNIILSDNAIALSAYELGNFSTVDDRLVGVYEITLKDDANTNIAINKVGLRNLLHNVYKDVDGALIVFVHGDKWRFSYVSEIRTKEGKQETEPKRYTYLFGKDESCRTAADRFYKLIRKPINLDDLYEAFSVDKLTKDFFKTYKEFFENFCDYLAQQPNYRKILLGTSNMLEKGWQDKSAKPIRDFIKKLLGRLVFLQFLQKKGWMGVPSNRNQWIGGSTKFIQTLFTNCPDKQHFHSTALKTLFFETLNIKRTKDLAPASLGGNIKIPYLNGGLFDKDNSFANEIDFPTDLFKNLLDFFEQYNFTIDENDPYDNEVGIDPEMLGHIFENLLEENREKGAFYTPKDIVKYMCQECLIEYLHTNLPNESMQDIEQLVRLNKVSDTFSTHKKANEISALLKQVKICDPAIGSGAFPMGLLKEIYECRRLLYGYLKSNTSFDPALVKKEIIQNNIYGVDRENGAVEIARLRFWLALVVDELEPQPLPNLDYKIMQGDSLLERFVNIDLQNLVNSDDEVVVSGVEQLTLGDNFKSPITEITIFDKATKEHLYSLISIYFDPENYEKLTGEQIDKAKLKKEISDIVESKIHAHIRKEQLKLKGDIAVIERKWKEAGMKDFDKLNQKAKEYKQYIAYKNQLEQIYEIEKKLIALQDSDDKPYFLWHLWFKDVFDKGGFDIIIGNPPYIQLQKLGDYCIDLEKTGFETFTRTGDIYCLFYEQGNNLLKQNGVLGYITSNTWMRTKFGESLRKYFAKLTNPMKLLNFEDTKIFQTATVETNIIITKKENYNNFMQAVAFRTDYTIGTSINEYFANNVIELSELPTEGWIILTKRDYEIKQQIAKQGTPLKDWDIEFYRGFLTGFNDAFFIDAAKRKELIDEDPKNIEIIKPLLRGREIRKYGYEFHDNYVLFTRRGFDTKKYPAITNHLKQYRIKLEPKPTNWDESKNGIWEGRKPGEYLWYDFQDNIAYYPVFDKDKLIWLSISDKPAFALDTLKMYVTAPAYIMTSKNKMNKYLLAVLNSKCMEWYLDKVSSSTGQGTNQWSKIFVEQLPIPILKDKNILQKFETMADYLIFLNDPTKPSVNPYTDNISIASVFENLVNMMVYELYFGEQMKNLDVDVLRYIDLKNISELVEEDKLDILNREYLSLLEKNNPIRNNSILSNIKMPDIIGRINATTH